MASYLYVCVLVCVCHFVCLFVGMLVSFRVFICWCACVISYVCWYMCVRERERESGPTAVFCMFERLFACLRIFLPARGCFISQANVLSP